MKEELRKLFEEILNDYESSEETVINDRGSLEDYNWLEQRIQEYKDRFEKIISTEEIVESNIIKIVSNSIINDIIQITFNTCHLTEEMKSTTFWKVYKYNKNVIVGRMRINNKNVYVFCSNKAKKDMVYIKRTNGKFEEYKIK